VTTRSVQSGVLPRKTLFQTRIVNGSISESIVNGVSPEKIGKYGGGWGAYGGVSRDIFREKWSVPRERSPVGIKIGGRIVIRIGQGDG